MDIIGKVKSFFKGSKGEYSMKRLIGIWCLVVASVIAITRGDSGAITTGIFMGAVTVIFGIQAATRT